LFYYRMNILPTAGDPLMPALVTLGARNLGGAILDHALAEGWSCAAVAQSDDTLDGIRARGAHAISADVTDPDQLDRALAEAAEALGGLDALVDAVSIARAGPGIVWGGGPLVDAGVDEFQSWASDVARQAFLFLSIGARALRAHGGGALIQVTNATSLHPAPGAGLWSAGHHAMRAMTLAAAQELRGEGIHAAVLAVDAPIDSPRSAPRLAADGIPPEGAVDMTEIAKAAVFLAGQGARGVSYELRLTSLGARWV
jgi:NAD(P)-dependent dehydrogenase (short-subunit alcohol dehydrogenase family)